MKKESKKITSSKTLKCEVTDEMVEDLNKQHSIDIISEMEEILVGELEKADIKEKIENRDEKIDDLLDEESED